MLRQPPRPTPFPYTTLFRSFTSTASCESKITYIDGDAGILLHRGYPIDQLAEKSSFLEVCYRSEEQRLNSSHTVISYAVFCLKKKKIQEHHSNRHSNRHRHT